MRETVSLPRLRSMERCPSCKVSARRWVRRRPIPPHAFWIPSFIALRPYVCDSCDWRGWRFSPRGSTAVGSSAMPHPQPGATAARIARPLVADLKIDDPLPHRPLEQSREGHALPSSTFSPAPARRHLPGRSHALVLIRILKRSARVASLVLRTAVHHRFVSATLGWGRYRHTDIHHKS